MQLFCILYKWIPIAPNTPLVCCCHTEISFNVGSMFSMLMVALLSFGCFLSCNVCKNKRVLSDDTSMHRPLCLDLLKVSSGSKEVFPCPGGSLRSQALEDRLQPPPALIAMPQGRNGEKDFEIKEIWSFAAWLAASMTRHSTCTAGSHSYSGSRDKEQIF